MSAVNLERRKRAVKISRAVNSIEGVAVSEKVEQIFALWADGKITGEQMKEQMLRLYAKA